MSEKHLKKGNEAFAIAAINAGCRYYFGYPITPQNEVPEYMSRELAKVGGSFIQAESELGAINMAYGAAAAGGRVLLSSSSPGIALMQESISLIASVELPVVIINVMRGGPGIGSIQPSQADYEQVTRGGGNGDYRTIVFAPSSIQETADMIYKAFDIAEEYRNPVIICADGMLGQMMEPVSLPPAREPVMGDAIREAKPYALTGHRWERERHAINSVWLQQDLLEEYIDSYWPKFEKAERELQDWEEFMLDDAEIVFVSYGSTARITKDAIQTLRKEGIKAGLIRPKLIWPFPFKAFEKLGDNVKNVVSVELSKAGQLMQDVKMAVEGKYPVSLINRYGGMLLSPDEIVERTKKLLEVK
ncbi:MAG: 3-methyl-2-oxobutanoate dehydrogenase subunit VorB [Eubacteriales bacterium]|nr:3-methyl-2-oxobutanoate dehydrogenase subunit VorB [Eubacteriales bacterium]MDY3332223.1 3-methyl-2-oxobutanoate dehydrogenase subunit VorB [Gallibacter sp.]